MRRELLLALAFGAAPTLADERPSESPPPADPADRMERVSFEDAVRRAIQRNPTITIAEQEIRRAEALVREVRAAALPTLTANGTYTRLDGDRTLGGGATCYTALGGNLLGQTACPPNTPGPAPRVIAGANQLSANLTLAVPLFAPQSWARWWHARDNVEIARGGDVDARRLLAVAAARAYLTVVSQKRVVEVTARARDAARAHYQFAHARFTGGVGNRIDEVRANQEMATDESQLQTALATLARAREALGVLLASDVPLDTAEEPRLPDPPPLDEALGGAAGARSDVKLAQSRVHAARKVERDNWADYAPLLTGAILPFYQNPPSLVQPLTGWQAQLVLTLPLYDGGLRYGQARERAALTAEARASLEATLRQARSDVRAAFESLRRSDDALAAARDAARLTHEALDLALLAYRVGATTNLEVIDAERRARDADTAVAIAEDSARQSRLDLLSSSGRFP